MNGLGEKGFTVFELLIVIMVVAITSATAVSNLRLLQDPLADASYVAEHFVRLARSKAISGTQVVRIAPTSTTTLGASRSDSCTGTMTTISDMQIKLPTGTSLASSSWSICFTPRGLVQQAANFVIQDTGGVTRRISVALGGGTRVDVM